MHLKALFIFILLSFTSFAGGISKKEFHKVISTIATSYSTDLKRIELKVDWVEDDVNMYASNNDGRAMLHIYGGLARQKDMNSDTFAIILCHELGHHLGGRPAKGILFTIYDPNFWASAEGQADLFASSKCMKRYLRGKKHKQYLSDVKVPEYVRRKCQETFTDPDSVGICIRTLLAAKRSVIINMRVEVDVFKISYSTPSKEVAISTDVFSYPKYQCRLDNFMAGTLCKISEYSDQYCERSRCWYR